MRSRRRTIDGLRQAVAALPRETKLAMLEGLERGEIIVGAYASPDGVCPMLAAHRAGGRTSLSSFADAWDRFGQRNNSSRRSRRATERELLVLRSHLRLSLLEEDAPSSLRGAIADHRRLASRPPEAPARRRTGRLRAGDRDRSRELAGRGGWAWTRVFRRYDDYAGALERLRRAGGDVGERERAGAGGRG